MSAWQSMEHDMENHQKIFCNNYDVVHWMSCNISVLHSEMSYIMRKPLKQRNF
jgi:hypothetical protein